MSEKKIWRLAFVRHGATDLNRELRWQGRMDVPLNEEGIEQAREAGERFSSESLVTVYSSPLRRAMQTAEEIAVRCGASVALLPWLTEIDHGEAEGLNQEEIEGRFPGLAESWRDEPHKTRFPGGGETLEDLACRMSEGLAELAGSEDELTILVTHQVAVAAARCLLEGDPLSNVWSMKLRNGESVIFEIDENQRDRMALGLKIA